ncbi:hypothetical protein CO2235_180101 [Cupriavidus oxalaticus]|uniref:Uncharacterized protein n=1 Tax=Cupriavidus oxalaticus TaxID=96344 RepID=A0A976BBY7_9BURK|nr:hypothetical protein CO2235_180101 [Cupriavidus oxalaticus]
MLGAVAAVRQRLLQQFWLAESVAESLLQGVEVHISAAFPNR